MKVVAVSDLHGHLPAISPCDVLLIGGDICPHFADPFLQNARDVMWQGRWLGSSFRDWLDAIPARHVVATWGNHDWVGERAPASVPPLRWKILVDEAVVIEGVKFYGAPWQPTFCDWAFNLTEPELERKWRRIPRRTDVMVFHGPPRGYGDNAPGRFGLPEERTGSPSQLKRILEVRPQLAIFGHIHNGRGQWNVDGVTLANVTVLNEAYRLVYDPMEFEVKPASGQPV